MSDKSKLYEDRIKYFLKENPKWSSSNTSGSFSDLILTKDEVIKSWEFTMGKRQKKIKEYVQIIENEIIFGFKDSFVVFDKGILSTEHGEIFNFDSLKGFKIDKPKGFLRVKGYFTKENKHIDNLIGLKDFDGQILNNFLTYLYGKKDKEFLKNEKKDDTIKPKKPTIKNSTSSSKKVDVKQKSTKSKSKKGVNQTNNVSMKNKVENLPMIDKDDILYEYVFKDEFDFKKLKFIDSFKLVLTKDEIIIFYNEKYHKKSMLIVSPDYIQDKRLNTIYIFDKYDLWNSTPDKIIFRIKYTDTKPLDVLFKESNKKFENELNVQNKDDFWWLTKHHNEQEFEWDRDNQLENFSKSGKLSNLLSFKYYDLEKYLDKSEINNPNFPFDDRYKQHPYLSNGSGVSIQGCLSSLTILEPFNIPFRGILTETEENSIIDNIKLILDGGSEKFLNLSSKIGLLKTELDDFKNDIEKNILNNNIYFDILKNNQSKIIEIDREYVQKFIKLNNYLKQKSSNLLLILEEVILNIENEPEIKIIEREDEINFFKGLVYSYNLMVNHSIVMVTSLVEDDMIVFYETYEVFDKMNVFNTNWENEVNDKLSEINESLQDLNFSIRGLMNQMRGMERNIVNGLQSINTSIGNLENSVNKQLSETNSRLKYENLTNYYKKSTLPGVMDWFDGPK